jgi:hypothetical protein
MYLVDKRVLILMSALLFGVAVTTAATANGQTRHKTSRHANLDAPPAIRHTTTERKIAAFEAVFEEKDEPPLSHHMLSAAKTLPVSSSSSKLDGQTRSSRDPGITHPIFSSILQL